MWPLAPLRARVTLVPWIRGSLDSARRGFFCKMVRRSWSSYGDHEGEQAKRRSSSFQNLLCSLGYDVTNQSSSGQFHCPLVPTGCGPTGSGKWGVLRPPDGLFVHPFHCQWHFPGSTRSMLSGSSTLSKLLKRCVLSGRKKTKDSELKNRWYLRPKVFPHLSSKWLSQSPGFLEIAKASSDCSHWAMALIIVTIWLWFEKLKQINICHRRWHLEGFTQCISSLAHSLLHTYTHTYTHCFWAHHGTQKC